MPGLPTVTPYVPKVPPIELPPEVPWPPEIEWPPLPGPWLPSPSPWSLPGLDLLPACWPEFATRFMALVGRVLRFRASLGLEVQWPPFDLRTWPAATKEMVRLASMYLAYLMWNTIQLPGDYIIAQTATPSHSARATAGGIYYTDSLRVSRTYGSGFAITLPESIPSKLASATIRLTNSWLYGAGTLTLTIRQQASGAPFTSYTDFITRRNGAAIIKTVEYSGQQPYWYIDMTDWARTRGGLSAFTFFIDDWTGVTPPSVTRDAMFFGYSYGLNPTLSVQKYGTNVTKMQPFLSELECSRMMAWLAYAEGVVGKHA